MALGSFRDDLQALVPELAARGARAWPDLPVHTSALLALAARAVEKGPGPAETLLERAEDLHLAAACAAAVPGSLEAFAARFFGEVEACVRGLGSGAPSADEVRQRLRCKLFLEGKDGNRGISRYSGAADLRSWFRIVALNEALTLRRARLREAPASEAEADLLQVPGIAADPELAYARRLYGDAVREALGVALAAVREKDRAVLRLQVIDRLSIEQIGAVYGIHKVSAARRVSAARARVAARTRRELRRRIPVPAEELDSILRLVRSALDVSVRRLLGGVPVTS